MIYSLVYIFFSFAVSGCANIDSTQQSQSLQDSNDKEQERNQELPAQNRKWKIGVVSDMNRSYGSTTYDSSVTKAIQYLKDSSVSVVLSTGDMVAGQKAGLNYDAMWTAFHSVTTKPLSQSSIPFLPSPGNHDASSGSSFKLERQKYIQTWKNYPLDRFNSVRPVDDQIKFIDGVSQNYPLNYALEMGPAIFIALDATATGGLINNQLDWLDDVLRKTSHKPVKIVFGHMPLYPFAFNRAHETLSQGTSGHGFFRKMENILEANRVQYFLSGHHHVYYPGTRNGFVRYVSVPLLGSGARQLMTADRSHQTLSPQGFLTIEFDQQGNVSMKSIRTSDMKEVSSSSLPPSVSVPSSSADDCRGCSSFPLSFFLDTGRRILYNQFSN